MPFDPVKYWSEYRRKNAGKWPIKRSPLKSRPVKIAPVSKSRAKQYRAYTPIRKKFLADNPECCAKLIGCNFHATEVHHKIGKIENRLIEVEHFLAVCRNCHDIIESQPLLAYRLGLSGERLKK